MQERGFVTKRMSAISPLGGKADLALGRELWRRGLRYRRRSRLTGRPDLVFASARVVVFVDGDFWHGRWLEDRIARGDFKRNAEYWIPKLRHRVNRDIIVTEQLTEQGWCVVRVWESDVKKDVARVVDQIVATVAGRTTRTPQGS